MLLASVTTGRAVLRWIVAGLVITTSLAVLTGCASRDETPEIVGADAGTEDLVSLAPTGKLPAGVRPVAYRLDLVVDPRRDDFSGQVAIDVELDRPTNRIWLHGRGLEVGDVAATTDTGEVMPGTYDEVLASGVSALSFGSELPAGFLTLRMRYRGNFDRNLAGLFKVEEQGDAYALAKSESIQARSYLPGFDEPGLKATFDISLTIPEGNEAIGNSAIVDRHPVGDDLQRITFGTTPPMSTYLLSLAVGPFDIVERAPIPPNEFRTRPVPLRGVTRRGRGGDMNFVLDVTPRMIEIYERALQRPYPFDKLDIVAAPQWPSGATELSAAITYREQRILVGDSPAAGARLALLEVHAHEVAHMWFGNQVTPPWWDDLWLKEGFATWAAPLVLTILEPDGGHELNAAEQWTGAMQLDSLASTRAIREPIADNDEIRNAYDSITYSKSLGVINMVDRYFGPAKFRPALGRYVEKFSDSVADSPDFYKVIGEETETPELTETFRGFVEQRGVPLVDVTLRCDNVMPPAITMRQSRYKALGSPIVDGGERWTIPICVRSTEAGQCIMMTEPQQTLRLTDTGCPRWVLPNAGGNGYYRWTLEEARWAALIEDFHLLSPVEALSAIDSAFAAFEAGKLDATSLLGIIAASSRAGSRQIITAPLPYLGKYLRQYFSTADKDRFLVFARDRYGPVIKRSAKSADTDEQLLYANLLSFMALSADDPDARAQLLGMAHAFTGFERPRDENAMSSDLYYPALAVAVQDSDAAFLAHLVGFRQELDDPLFASASANAIGNVNDPDQAGTVYELALGEQTDPRETFGMLTVALLEPSLRERHWVWLQDNFPAIVARIPAQWRRYLPRMAEGFCSVDKADELRALFEKYGDLAAGYKRSLNQTEEKIGLCIALREQGRKFAGAASAPHAH